MKALKEKRVSLRTFLRRGLVILSLFALAFASCSDSSGGTTPLPTDPTDGTNPPPAGPTIKSLTILTQPTKASFQGYMPDLTDLAIEVEWSNGTREYAYYNETPSAFGTVPGICEYAFPNPSDKVTGKQETFGMGDEIYGRIEGSTLQLVYKGQPAPVTVPVKVPMVVGASRIEVTQSRIVDWYSDMRPDFDGLVYNVIFDTGWLGLGKDSVDGVLNPYLKLEAKMNAALPKVDYKDAVKFKKAYAYLGPIKGTHASQPGIGYASINAMGTNNVSTDFGVNYYGVAGVKFADANWKEYFDDDIEKFYTKDAKGYYSVDPIKVFDALKKSNVKFEVSYLGSDRKETITAEQYVANNQWYYGISTSGQGISNIKMLEDLVVASDGVTWQRGNMTRAGLANSSLTQGLASVLWYGQDEDNEESWRVRLNYIPWSFNNSADYTQVDVPIPLYLFEELELVNKAPGVTNITLEGWNDAKGQGGIQMDPAVLDAIAKRWDLVGVYVSGRSQARKTIGITSAIIYGGFYGRSVEMMGGAGAQSGWASLNYWQFGVLDAPNAVTTGAAGTNAVNVGKTPANLWYPNTASVGYDSIRGVPLASGEIRRDFYLPLYYRGQKLIDDEGIGVDLVTR